MVTIAHQELQEYVSKLLVAAGCPVSVATRVAYALVESNLVGHDSHGVMRIPAYIDAIRAGTLIPTGAINVVAETPSTTLLDCGWNFGHVGAAHGMELAIEKARVQGLGMTVLRHCDHTGRIGEYVVMAAQHGMIGQVFCNGSSPGGLVAPFGGTQRALGANPIAWGIPGGDTEPIFLDFATAAVAHGKIEVAADKGELLPEGFILDKFGRPTRDPRDALDGGVILPFGGHKGYALGVLIELIGGGLSGVGFPLVPGYRWDQGTVLLAVNVETFQPLAAFKQMISEFKTHLKSLPPAPGVDEILLPGEMEWQTKRKRVREGIPFPETTWKRIVEVAALFGITHPVAVTQWD